MVEITTFVVKSTTNRASQGELMMTKAVKADEPTGAPKEQVPKVDEPTPEPDDPSKEAQSDDSAEKLKSMESELGRFKQELGDERKKSEELNAYKLWYDQNAAKTQQQVPQQSNYEEADKQWYDKPTETFEHLSKQRDAKMAYQTAYQLAPGAKAMAKMQHPEAFEGIADTELDQAMFGGVQSGTMNPNILGDPNAWLMTTWALRGSKLGFKIPTAPPGDMSTTETETPGTKPPGEEKEIPDLQGDDLTNMLIKRMMSEGLTKEQAIEKVQATKDRGGR